MFPFVRWMTSCLGLKEHQIPWTVIHQTKSMLLLSRFNNRILIRILFLSQTFWFIIILFVKRCCFAQPCCVSETKWTKILIRWLCLLWSFFPVCFKVLFCGPNKVFTFWFCLLFYSRADFFFLSDFWISLFLFNRLTYLTIHLFLDYFIFLEALFWASLSPFEGLAGIRTISQLFLVSNLDQKEGSFFLFLFSIFK